MSGVLSSVGSESFVFLSFRKDGQVLQASWSMTCVSPCLHRPENDLMPSKIRWRVLRCLLSGDTILFVASRSNAFDALDHFGLSTISIKRQEKEP